MANTTFSNLNQTILEKEAQRSLYVENKAMSVARVQFVGPGGAIDRALLSYPSSNDYTPGTDINTRPIVATKETLTLGTHRASLVTLDDTEKVMSSVEFSAKVARDMMRDHKNKLEQVVLGQASNATWALDAGNVGGSAGSNAAVDTDTVPQFFTAADTKLDGIDAPKAGRTAVVGGHFMGQLKLQQAARGTAFSDGVNTNGVVANLFGWDIVESNNLPYYAKLDMTTIPVAADTVTIAGVVFTAKASGAATGAGGFSIGDAAADACLYLVAAINYNSGLTAAAASAAAANAGTIAPVAASFIDLSGEDRFVIRDKRRITATYATTYLVINGFGDIVVSEALTPAGSVWSLQKQTALFCVRGFTDLAVQIPPKLEQVRDPDQFATIVKSLLSYGNKTYADGAREAVKVSIDAGTSDWS